MVGGYNFLMCGLLGLGKLLMVVCMLGILLLFDFVEVLEVLMV